MDEEDEFQLRAIENDHRPRILAGESILASDPNKHAPWLDGGLAVQGEPSKIILGALLNSALLGESLGE